MNMRLPIVVIFFSAALLNTACSFAPITPRVDAASIGRGEWKLESNFAPSLHLGAIHGVTDKLDIGMEVEQLVMGSAWARYSFINNPSGFSLAGNAGVFTSHNDFRSNGYYLGAIVSNQISPKTRFTFSYRYAQLDYEFDANDDDDLYWLSLLDFDNATDAAVNGQVDATLSVLLKPHVELALGAVCQTLYNNTDPDNRSDVCFPVIGMSYYRR